ncbi:MAG: citryl-CoA lyase [Gracilibacteraceae bacterium]|nr:citryl-CoA lyase [Gracilibacteraceae bacterium]
MKSLMIANANNPKILLDAVLYGADGIMFDLAESVPDTEKDAARLLLAEALAFLDYSAVEVVVRPNCPCQKDFELDILTVAPSKPCDFVVPMAKPEFVTQAAALLDRAEAENDLPAGGIRLIPSIDSAAGVENVAAVIAASPRVRAVMFNAKEFLADLGAAAGGAEQLVYARSKIAVACHVAGIDSLDTPYAGKPDGLAADAGAAKALGFTGKVASDGKQVKTINSVFA